MNTYLLIPAPKFDVMFRSIENLMITVSDDYDVCIFMEYTSYCDAVSSYRSHVNTSVYI